MTLTIRIWNICILSVCTLMSCGQHDVPTVKLGKSVNLTDTIGIESIATRIDTLTIHTDSLYDIELFGISDDRLFGLTADNIIVILDRSGQVINSVKRIGRVTLITMKFCCWITGTKSSVWTTTAT